MMAGRPMAPGRLPPRRPLGPHLTAAPQIREHTNDVCNRP